MFICMYCKKVSINEPMFIVKKSTRPKGYPYRWKSIGYCCEQCASKGKPTKIGDIK